MLQRALASSILAVVLAASCLTGCATASQDTWLAGGSGELPRGGSGDFRTDTAPRHHERTATREREPSMQRAFQRELVSCPQCAR